MKTTHCVMLVAAAFLIGLQFINHSGPFALAQSEASAKPVGRYQISAWSHPAGGGRPNDYGCFIVDTATGELWHKKGDQVVQHAGSPRP